MIATSDYAQLHNTIASALANSHYAIKSSKMLRRALYTTAHLISSRHFSSKATTGAADKCTTLNNTQPGQLHAVRTVAD